jgi:hypothetical protein
MFTSVHKKRLLKLEAKKEEATVKEAK